MRKSESGAAAPSRAQLLLLRLILFAIWLVLVLYLAWHHVPWRDEMRAFTIALSGESTLDMLRNLHGEGHPAIWYLLLRFAHALVPVREVLLGVAVLVAAAAMLMLVLKSPLRLIFVALFMFGGFGLFEYAVSARNYGISMAMLFVIAWAWPHWRDKGVRIGLLLALLCNTNVPANFLAAALLGFWLIEIFSEEGFRWNRKYGWWLANAGIAALGAAICFLTVFPTVHDAASIDHPEGITAWRVLAAIVNPAAAFPDLAAPSLLTGLAKQIVIPMLLIGSLAGLARAPAALLAGLGMMLFFQLFYQLVYPGSYRHQGLLLVFMLTLYWLVAAGRGGRWPERWTGLQRTLRPVAATGIILFELLLALQLVQSFHHLAMTARGVPYSRAADLAELLEREGLTDAVLIADPDVMLEPLPYQAGNPVYFHREAKFGGVVLFTARARLDIRLDDILAEARRLSAETGRPVVIVMQHRLDPNAPPRIVPEPYVGSFITDPDQVRRFLGATRRLASFGPAMTDETYDVYLLTD